MRLLLLVVAALGVVVIVGLTVAPSQPVLRDWYIAQACPYLDMLSTDICAPVRRAADNPTRL